MIVRPKNKCECGRYKSEIDEVCIYCDPTINTKSGLTCTICNLTKRKEYFFSDTVCRDCAEKIHLRGERLCKHCGFIGKKEKFNTIFMCLNCHKEKGKERTKQYRASLKGKLYAPNSVILRFRGNGIDLKFRERYTFGVLL